MNQRPTYLSHGALALEININPNNITEIIRRWKNHPDNPTPKPDAWCTMPLPHGHNTPLWLTERLPEWHEWKERRDTIVAELQAQERTNTAKKAWTESLT
jgi:hypothetical protein